MADLHDIAPTVISGLALLVAVGKPIGRFLAGLVDGIRAAPHDERPSRTAIAPAEPTELDTIKARVATLEADRKRRDEQEAADRAELVRRELKAAVRDMTAALRSAKPTKEKPADAHHDTDPPTDP